MLSDVECWKLVLLVQHRHSLSPCTEISLHQGQEMVAAAAQTVCRQGREWACLMCCFLFASLLHLPLPPPHPKRFPIKLCIPAVEIVGFHLVSFGH